MRSYKEKEMTFDEMCAGVERLIPGAQIEEDNYGQIIVYTNQLQSELDNEKSFRIDQELRKMGIGTDYEVDNEGQLVLYTGLTYSIPAHGRTIGETQLRAFSDRYSKEELDEAGYNGVH